MVYNKDNEILTFQRSDNGNVWQFPQGGIEVGESPINTLWRELREETGLTEEKIESVAEYQKWTVYTYPPQINNKLGDNMVLGQAHRWFFLRLKSDTAIDLGLATEKEFTNFKWTTFADLIKQNDFMKIDVYRDLSTFFNTLR